MRSRESFRLGMVSRNIDSWPPARRLWCNSIFLSVCAAMPVLSPAADIELIAVTGTGMKSTIENVNNPNQDFFLLGNSGGAVPQEDGTVLTGGELEEPIFRPRIVGYLWDNGTLNQYAIEGENAPPSVPDSTLTGISLQHYSPTDGFLLMSNAQKTNSLDKSVVIWNRPGLGAELSPIFKSGDPAPGVPGFTLSSPQRSPTGPRVETANRGGSYAFTSWLDQGEEVNQGFAAWAVIDGVTQLVQENNNPEFEAGVIGFSGPVIGGDAVLFSGSKSGSSALVKWEDGEQRLITTHNGTLTLGEADIVDTRQVGGNAIDDAGRILFHHQTDTIQESLIREDENGLFHRLVSNTNVLDDAAIITFKDSGSTFARPLLTPDGRAVFLARFRRPGDVSDQVGIWRERENGSGEFDLLVDGSDASQLIDLDRFSNVAANVPQGAFDVDNPVISPDGRIAFLATIGNANLTTTNDMTTAGFKGLFAEDSGGEIHLVARTGQAIEYSYFTVVGVIPNVATIATTNAIILNNLFLGRDAMDSRGRVGFLASMSTAGTNAPIVGNVGYIAQLPFDPGDNTAPVLSPIADQTVDEEAPLSFTAQATDSDTPEQTLTFSLGAGAPDGAEIDPDTAEFSWTPTEEQGEGEYPITVVVSDSFVPPATDSRSFNVTVNEVNQAPVLPTVGNLEIPAGAGLSLDLRATDPDEPQQSLSYSLVAPSPPGMSINPTTGFLFYPVGQVPGLLEFQVTVEDDQSPPLSDQATISLNIVAGQSPGLMPGYDSSQGFSLDAVGAPGSTFVVDVSSDLSEWLPLLSMYSFDGQFAWTDPESAGLDERFYRLTQYGPLPPIYFKGGQVLLAGEVVAALGPNPRVFVDLDGSETYSTVVQADAAGRYCAWVDLDVLDTVSEIRLFYESSDGTRQSPILSQVLVPDLQPNPALVVPVNQISGGLGSSPEPNICTCVDCQNGGLLGGASLSGFTHSYTPTVDRVELSTGKIRHQFPIVSFATRLLGFDFHLYHASLVDYDGPFGRGVSHSFNMMIVRTGTTTGQIITPDLRIFPISTTDQVNWTLPDGFFSQLVLDQATGKWRLTHFSGLQVEFYCAPLNVPGRPTGIHDPNGNRTTLVYDGNGLLTGIVTDLGQEQTLTYDSTTCRLTGLRDHIGRQWNFSYDANGNLQTIAAPAIEYADIPVGALITDTELPGVLVYQPRTTTLAREDSLFPDHITRITDPRGAVPLGYTYDAQGRVVQADINGHPQTYAYRVENDAQAVPSVLPLLDIGNRVTRVTDRVGNITDTEMHGPVNPAQHGIRRRVTWTETGRGNPPLRPGEPAYYEQRWLQDCGCLAPAVVVQPFSSGDLGGLTFNANGIPENWPRSIYTYNSNRQVTDDVYTDGTESIRSTRTFQAAGFGQNQQYSRKITETDPRAYDDNPIYAGREFTHEYEYDNRGNRTEHHEPTVTLGQTTAQTAVERWSYNQYGQKTHHEDFNGNITRYDYHAGPSTGGGINSVGEFWGYLAAVTRGATGSADGDLNLVTRTRVNALGMITEKTDPKGYTYGYEYNDAGQTTREIDPPVTLANGSLVQYETRHIYDAVGNRVMNRRSNIDADGVVLPNEFIDSSFSYDAVGNLLATRREIDNTDANDLVTEFGYDQADRQIVARKPEGNRTFTIYDERNHVLRRFDGVSSAPTVDADYPADPRATSLGGSTFISMTSHTHDPRGNRLVTTDGRGNDTQFFYDFYDRRVAHRDPNGNGTVNRYDDVSNVLQRESGIVSPLDGSLTLVLSRDYQRYDERGRRYQATLDIDLSSDESSALDPSTPQNSTLRTVYDAGSRVIRSIDANENETTLEYDSGNRRTRSVGNLGNQLTFEYDKNSNRVAVRQLEVAGPGSEGDPELYVSTYTYDEFNRPTTFHDRGLDGISINHETQIAYDSRSNQKRVLDAEGRATLHTFDDANRLIREQRFDEDPLLAGNNPSELSRVDYGYDRNDRKTMDRTFSDLQNPLSIQETKYAYDDLDRQIRTVYPDSDDPIDGSNDGPDGQFDRVERGFDANSNPVQVIDQRGVQIVNTYDPANRLVQQDIDIAGTTVPAGSVTRTQFAYDVLNRLTHAANNFTLVTRAYDTLSRLVSEIQWIKLDGSGQLSGSPGSITHNYEQPVDVQHTYDRQSNDIACMVVDGQDTDLAVTRTVDALHRVSNIKAGYFGTPSHDIVSYRYFGPGRIQKKTLGNGAHLQNTFDVKRRLATHVWRDTESGLLVGCEYSDAVGNGYTKVDVGLYERFLHDQNRYDHFTYNARDELVGVEYRSTNPTPSATPGDTYTYDDNNNRTAASVGDPFNAHPNTLDSYANNAANEYTQLTRDGASLNPAYDRAGNMTVIPTRPVTGIENQPDVTATARWDAANCLFDIDTQTANGTQHHRYDPFRRRIAVIDSLTDIQGSRRFIYDGSSVCEERLFNSGATLANAPSRLERVYIEGPRSNEHLLAAIDRNGDGQLGGTNSKNQRDVDADQEYYYLSNRHGSTMAVLDADNSERVLEFYRHEVFGETVVLPPIDGVDGLEATPDDLADNHMTSSLRESQELGNPYLWFGNRFDGPSGLYLDRMRYVVPGLGRSLNRSSMSLMIPDILSVPDQTHNSSANPTSALALYAIKQDYDLWMWQYNQVDLELSRGPKNAQVKSALEAFRDFARGRLHMLEQLIPQDPVGAGLRMIGVGNVSWVGSGELGHWDWEKWRRGDINASEIETLNCFQFVQYTLKMAEFPEKPLPARIVTGIDPRTGIPIQYEAEYREGHKSGTPEYEEGVKLDALRGYLGDWAGHYSVAPKNYVPQRGDVVIWFVAGQGESIQGADTHVGMFTGRPNEVIHNLDVAFGTSGPQIGTASFWTKRYGTGVVYRLNSPFIPNN